MDSFTHPKAPGSASRLKSELTGGQQSNPVQADNRFSLPGATVTQLLSDPRFLVVPETMVDGLIVIDNLGIVQYVNPACLTLFGYSKDELIGQNVKMLMPPPFKDEHDNHLARHRTTGVKRIIGIGRELSGQKSDGTIFPMYLSVGEAKTDDSDLFVGIIYDLTDKKRAEEVILHHQKLDAIGQLSGGVAHDFNNILGVIGGNLEMIANVDLPPAARRALARAQDAAKRAARITQRLLAFARKQPLNKQPVDLNRALRDMSELLQRTIGESIQIRMHLMAANAIVVTDIDQFETAILNLALNARDAMPNGGALAIETEPVAFDEDPRSAPEVPRGAYIRVSVSDTGCGMNAEVSARAIEPFYTTKDVGSGTGLGLSMVYGFMKQINGYARLYSEVGKGTRVSLFFPYSATDQQILTEVQDDFTPTGNGETILVVEDDPDVRLVTVSRLEGLGYSVRIAADGNEGLQIVRSGAPVDLALIDVVMPGGMDGHALAHEISVISPNMPIILTSGYSPRMATSGMDETQPFLQKPASRGQLARLVNQVLAENRNRSN